jgi:hypothetical protein
MDIKMNHKPMGAITVLFLFSAGILAGAAGPAFEQNSPALSHQEINSLLISPIKNIGQNCKSVKTKLGTWISLKTKTIANQHEVGQIDRLHTIKYDGLILTLYEVVKYKKEMLISVKMVKNYPGILPELIGMKKEDFKSRFGAAVHVEGNAYKYAVQDEIGENSVSFKFENNILVGIDWSYYLD